MADNHCVFQAGWSNRKKTVLPPFSRFAFVLTQHDVKLCKQCVVIIIFEFFLYGCSKFCQLSINTLIFISCFNVLFAPIQFCKTFSLMIRSH